MKFRMRDIKFIFAKCACKLALNRKCILDEFPQLETEISHRVRLVGEHASLASKA